MRLVQIYKASAREEMYLYVDFQRDLKDVPEALLSQFGELSPVMSLKLTPEKKLARVKAQEVLDDIDTKGFFLQMPPTPAQLMSRNDARE